MTSNSQLLRFIEAFLCESVVRAAMPYETLEISTCSQQSTQACSESYVYQYGKEAWDARNRICVSDGERLSIITAMQ